LHEIVKTLSVDAASRLILRSNDLTLSALFVAAVASSWQHHVFYSRAEICCSWAKIRDATPFLFRLNAIRHSRMLWASHGTI